LCYSTENFLPKTVYWEIRQKFLNGIFSKMSQIWPARAIRRCENWGRVGYLIAGPFAVGMSLQALRDAEFFQGLLYLLFLTLGIVYVIALVILLRPETKKAFLRSTTPDEERLWGKGFSVLWISVAGFLFAWWWTNLSAALHLIGTGDFQGILICLGGLAIAAALGALGLRTWWSRVWGTITGLVFLFTGWVLLEHALCYSAITALVYLGGRQSAFGMTGLIIGGRLLFALIALIGGIVLWRMHKYKVAAII
jgi:hypothetical protein